jgi:hypothetical protein
MVNLGEIMNKILTYANVYGFKAFMAMYTVAFTVGMVLFNVVLKPVLAVLWAAAKHMPDDFGSEEVDDVVGSAAKSFAGFVDNHIFKQPAPNYVIVPDEEYKANFKF